jgi:hypothetical protein
MNGRLALFSAFAPVAIAGLAGCGDGATIDWGAPPPGDGGGSSETGSATPDGGGGTLDGRTSDASADAGSVSDGRESGGNTDGPPDGGSIVTPATKVAMYLPNWSGSYASWATMIDFDKMTHLLLAFGTVSGTNDWGVGAADSDVQTLAAAAHAAHVKVLVSIGGADDDIGIINAYGSASNIAPLVANLDAMVARLDLDGVDVDLERGGMMSSGTNYPAFVSQLLSTFHPEGKLVTSALAQYIVQDAGGDATIMGVARSFDFINDMIYTTNIDDYTNEANWWTSTVGLSNEKLVWGILFGNGLGVDTAKQITTASKAYGGVMCWEYSQPTEVQLWPAIQSVL